MKLKYPCSMSNSLVLKLFGYYISLFSFYLHGLYRLLARKAMFINTVTRKTWTWLAWSPILKRTVPFCVWYRSDRRPPSPVEQHNLRHCGHLDSRKVRQNGGVANIWTWRTDPTSFLLTVN
jgi:hypothetical protein